MILIILSTSFSCLQIIENAARDMDLAIHINRSMWRRNFKNSFNFDYLFKFIHLMTKISKFIRNVFDWSWSDWIHFLPTLNEFWSLKRQLNKDVSHASASLASYLFLSFKQSESYLVQCNQFKRLANIIAHYFKLNSVNERVLIESQIGEIFFLFQKLKRANLIYLRSLWMLKNVDLVF